MKDHKLISPFSFYRNDSASVPPSFTPATHTSSTPA